MEYITGPNGEKLRLHYESRPETWTEKELLVAILNEVQAIRKATTLTITKEQMGALRPKGVTE